MSEQYLILSLKWTQSSEMLVWYRPNSAGYTSIIDHAGLYSREDAKEHEMKGVTVAVPYSIAMACAGNVVIRERLNSLISLLEKRKQTGAAA